MSALEDFPRPSLAVDPVVLGVAEGRLITRLWCRSNPPQQGCWALPGVFVNPDEDFEDAVDRALRTKLRISETPRLRQLFAWNKTDRDPRGWVVTVAYYAMLSASTLEDPTTIDETIGVFSIDLPPGAKRAQVRDRSGRRLELAFDHDEILALVIETLRRQLWSSDQVLDALPPRFTLREMQTVYEAILGEELNKDSFRRRVTKTHPLVKGTGKLQEDVDHRPAELFRRARSTRS